MRKKKRIKIPTTRQKKISCVCKTVNTFRKKNAADWIGEETKLDIDLNKNA